MVIRKGKGPLEEDRPSPLRRSFLTGGAIGLAAAAGAGVAGAPPASAATGPVSVTDWLNVTDYGAKGDGIHDDSVAINQALAHAAGKPSPLTPGNVVYLPVGDAANPGNVGIYLIYQPLLVPEGVCLRGPVPVNDDAGKDVEDAYSAVIKVSGPGNWNPPASVPHPAAVVLLPSNYTQAGSVLRRPVVESLWIDGSNLPATTVADGIAATGSVLHALIRNVGVWQASGNGIAAYPYQLAPGNALNADGWEVASCMVQSCGGMGVSFFGEDTLFQAVHVQTCAGDGFSIQHGNNRFLGCRADQSQSGSGFTIDPASSLKGSTTLIGCGTEGNAVNGLNVVNQTTPGRPNGMVVASGCSFDFDQNAGISVSGQNIVTLTGCNVCAGTDPNTAKTGPKYALATAKPTGTNAPMLVQAVGGFWNCTSGTLVHDSAPAALMSYAVHAVTGGEVGGTGSSAVTLMTKNPL